MNYPFLRIAWVLLFAWGCGQSRATTQGGSGPTTSLGRRLSASSILDPSGTPICQCDPYDPSQDCTANDGDADEDDGCIICQDGNACVPANPCHVGSLACEGGPACGDTGQNVPDGTACGSGRQCQTGSCTPICTPASCAPGQCGAISDNCGGTLQCGGCANGFSCQSGTCTAVCTPATCAPGQCGAISDNCGGTLQCGGCANGYSCQASACASAIVPGTYGFGALEIDYPVPAPPWYSNAPTWHNQQMWIAIQPASTDGSFASVLTGPTGAVALTLNAQNGAFLGIGVDSSGDSFNVTFNPAMPTGNSGLHVYIQYSGSSSLVKSYYDANNANPSP